MSVITGTGAINDTTDYKAVKWVGKTKGGDAIEILLDNAINMGNIEWTFAEKNDTVPAVTFTACYSNTNSASSSTAEPWHITSAVENAGASEILLGAGVFYIGNTAVALTRGGGSFNVTREFRRINADGDRGAVKGRVIMDASEATLAMNILTMLTRMADIYPAIEVDETPEG